MRDFFLNQVIICLLNCSLTTKETESGVMSPAEMRVNNYLGCLVVQAISMYIACKCLLWQVQCDRQNQLVLKFLVSE